MKLDFKAMDENWLANFKGGEKGLLAKMFADDHNRIIKARLIAGATVGDHAHEMGSEIIFALSGEATATRLSLLPEGAQAFSEKRRPGGLRFLRGCAAAIGRA